MSLWSKNSRYLEVVFILIAIFCIGVVSAQNISINYNENVIQGEEFDINITLIDFPADIYDVKVDISNGTTRLSEIWDGTAWKSTRFYVYDIINNSISNFSSFKLNITEDYIGIANMEIKIRESNNKDYENFQGYKLNISINNEIQEPPPEQNETQNNTNPPVAEREIEAEFDEETDADKEFSVKVKIYNFDEGDYDAKIMVYDESEDIILSEIYDEKEGKWRSSNYYISEIISGINSSKNFDLRIKDVYYDYDGNYDVIIRIRESGESDYEEYKDRIRINKVEESSSSSNQDLNDNSEREKIIEELFEEHENQMIYLNSQNKEEENPKMTKSEAEKIRDYSIYGFFIFCLAVLFIIIFKKDKL